MIKICAWCNKTLDLSNANDSTEDTPITHGICSDCVREAMSFKAKSLESVLNRYSDPVFYINSEIKIMAANIAGCSLLNKDPKEVNGKLTGVAFDCRYADFPEGCGNAVHCRTCTIRNCIKETLRSGKSNIKVPAYPDLHHITEEHQIRFLITTERIGEVVLLRIDDVTEETSHS